MEGRQLLSLRRTEISLKNFNNVAIPHHLDLLAKHKNNIYKFHKLGDMGRVKSEQINATRIITQLKHLLEEMDMLRQQVISTDLAKFDQMTETSRKNTIQAIKEYIDLSQFSNKRLSVSEYSSRSSVASHEDIDVQNYGMLQEYKTNDGMELSELQLQERESCLKSWENLHVEINDIHELFIKCEEVIKTQAEPVNMIEERIETANENVSIARSILQSAERYKTKWYPVAGALVGGCIAGPIGLITGLKIGGIAFIGGTALGFTGGNILKKHKENNNNPPSSSSEIDDIKNK